MAVALDEKIAQMIMVGFRGTSVSAGDPIVDALQHGWVGGVWLCDYVAPDGARRGNIASPEQFADLIQALKRCAPRPLLLALDAEGGQVIRLKPAYGFPQTPSAAQLGAADDLAATGRAADGIAATLRDLGINLNLAPVVDLNRAPDNPSLGGKARCFAADAALVTRHARTFIERHRAARVACTLKHFPGQGSALDDAHHGVADVTRTWLREELTPFVELCHAGLADAVLVGHVFHRELDAEWPATLSHRITTGLLRQELGFEGVVICDDLGMGAIRDHYGFDEAIARAIEAGADLLLHANTNLHYPDMGQRTHATVKRLVEKDRVSVARIDASYERIMRLKAWCAPH